MAENTATDRQDVAEELDRDEIVTDPDFTGDRPTDFPPDRPSASLDEAPDAADEAYGEPLDERMERERPDPLAEELTPRHRTDSPAPATASDDGLGAFAPTDDVFADFDDDQVARLPADQAMDLAAGDEGRSAAGRESDAVGQIVDPDADVADAPAYTDDIKDEVALEEPALGDETAEEQAVHVIE
ncbi:MAG: hypothetical protein S0880_00275 [Actinomycetota bacterium]|nr:hypothetical protein [Actinomycetota bacterium]